MTRSLELLAPAKNLETGKAAIEHGADAVYIGAMHHGARAAAGNSLEDIRELCDYAHKFGAAVHVTVNTIVYDDELEATLNLIERLCGIGVDALLIQDMGLLREALLIPSVAEAVGKGRLSLHASTQCDNRTAEKVSWLSSQGFDRVVLARELSIDEIRAIHDKNPQVEIEAFVHGALCVSYSGLCYASQYCFSRSANRGDCAQFCRMEFDLVDADSRVWEHNRHLLSLKDLCLIDHLQELADAGVSAFKIEGRLKDAGYVKNVVSAYSQKLDAIVSHSHGKYRRASRGQVKYTFTPDLHKTFNRGYTTYFAHGRQPGIFSPDTPKALGEYVGHVKEIRRDSFNVAGTTSFSNGDGLCFVNAERQLEGFRVNRAVGNRLYPHHMPEHLKPGMKLYRNNDVEFSKVLSGKTAERKIPVKLLFEAVDGGFRLTMNGHSAEVAFDHQIAKRPQGDNIRSQLSKLGNTVYEASEVMIASGADRWFVPSSLLSQLRREVCEMQVSVADAPSITRFDETGRQKTVGTEHDIVWSREYREYPYIYNISNHAASSFYESQGLKRQEQSFEQQTAGGKSGHTTDRKPLIMQCRHCLRYSLGYCMRRGGKKAPWREPVRLRLGDGREFDLEFRCDECQMNVFGKPTFFDGK